MALLAARPRHPVGLVVLLLVTSVLVSRERTTPVATQEMPPLQAAVLRDGFAILEAVGDRHLVEIARSGARRRRSAIPTVTETRAFGSAQGASVGWLEKKKLHLAAVKDDGKLGKVSSWGTSVRMMCDGVASNDQRFAIGWLEERDERIWFVHGPTHPSSPGVLDVEVAAIPAPPAPATWCAVRSANEYVALVYRIQAKTYVNMCSRKECGVVTPMPIDPRDDLLDIACQHEGCVAAVRPRGAAPQLVAFNLRGKVTWKKPLAYAAPDTRIQLAAAGDRAYVMSLVTNEGPVIERMLAKSGLSGRTWQGAQDLPAPAVAWSKDQLMLAYWDGDALAHDVFALPR